MKNYEQFCEALREEVAFHLPPGCRTQIHQVVKNNALKLDGLVILSKEHNVSPNFYLDGYYKKYEEGESLEELALTIMAQYKDVCFQESDTKVDLSLESCRDNIVYRLVSKAMNMELLKTIPSIDFLDMVVVFYIVVRKSEDGIGSIRINEELMEQWGLSVNELFQYAMENTQRIFPKKIRNMFSMISELIQEKDWELSEQMENEEHWQQPYIITNDAGINGAGAILYPDTLKETARLLGGDYYIIPSSIHEVLAVSKRSHLTKKELLAMVKDVNETAVAKDEILSNVIYDYSVHTERMCICSGF